MRVSDILRQMADVVDQVEGGEQVVQQPAQEPVAQEPIAEPAIQAPAIQGQIEMPGVETPCDAVDDTDLGPMVSPLQQEHELLKKSQGVDNNVSEFAGDDADDGFDSELASMKQAAGIGEEKANAAAHEEQRRMEDQLNPRANAAKAFHKERANKLK